MKAEREGSHRCPTAGVAPLNVRKKKKIKRTAIMILPPYFVDMPLAEGSVLLNMAANI